jgi:hypothetical protein
MNHFILYITHLLLPICIIICSVSTSFAQLTELQLSTKTVFSDVTGRNDFNERIIDANTWKYSKGLSLGANFNIWKNRLSLRTNLFYNERKALEFFTFGVEGTPDLEQYPFLSRRFTFLRWASSPQSDLFYNENFEHPFIHFPNFKYLHLELLPIYTFSIGEKWSIQSGVGISGGILLNRAENTIGREYFPAFDELFESGMLVGEVEYHRYDVNVMGQLGVRYRVSPALSVGISSGVHHSLIHLNDSFRESISRQVNWLIITPGIDVVYHLKRDDGGE